MKALPTWKSPRSHFAFGVTKVWREQTKLHGTHSNQASPELRPLWCWTKEVLFHLAIFPSPKTLPTKLGHRESALLQGLGKLSLYVSSCCLFPALMLKLNEIIRENSLASGWYWESTHWSVTITITPRPFHILGHSCFRLIRNAFVCHLKISKSR